MADKVYKTKWWRLVRPDHLKVKAGDSAATKAKKNSEWKAFKTLHGGSKGSLGHHIFGDPPGTGALQAAANNKAMRVNENDPHHINWKSDDKVGPAIKGIRGDGKFDSGSSMKHRAELHKLTGKWMKPSEARKHLMATHYQVDYGPDGRAK